MLVHIDAFLMGTASLITGGVVTNSYCRSLLSSRSVGVDVDSVML